MHILVTGGCGFIGSNFIRYMLKKYQDIRIINLDKLTYAGNVNSLKDITKDKRYRFIKGDICDEKLVNSILRSQGHGSTGSPSLVEPSRAKPRDKVTRSQVIVNFAAETHVDRSIKNAADFIKTNVEGVRVLLEVVKRYKIKKFLHISTDETYGDIKEGFSKETDKLLSNSPYAASKAAADLLCLAYYHTYNLPILITRSSNNFGPYQYPEKVIPLFITNLLESKKVPLYGDGKNIREWIYVEDNCSAIDFVLRKGKVGEVYNIGSANRIRNIDMVKAILEKFGLKSDYINYVTDRPGHDRRYALDSTKVKRLGWQPNYSFDRALALTINWYKQNQRWWKPLKRKAKIIKW